MKIARLITSFDNIDLRHAEQPGIYWPGSGPLPQSGYWIGNKSEHRYIGTSAAEATNTFRSEVNNELSKRHPPISRQVTHAYSKKQVQQEGREADNT